VQLEPLPCWAYLPAAEYRRRIEAEVEIIESQAARKRELLEQPARGPAAIRAQEPHAAPEKLKKSPAPRFHAASRKIRQELYDGYRYFVAAFRDASARLRAGEPGVAAGGGLFVRQTVSFRRLSTQGEWLGRPQPTPEHRWFKEIL